jgi:hypothetical protein
MINFRLKNFTEYEAMKSLYNKLMEISHGDKRKFPVIDKSALIPILRGNSVVIERFVISTSFFGKDKYRMYLRIGAKAKMPDEVRLPGVYKESRLLDSSVDIKVNKNLFPHSSSKQGGEKKYSDTRVKLFAKGGNGEGFYINSQITPVRASIQTTIRNLLGDAIKYSKPERLLVLEFSSIDDAVRALNILPFGINYKIYILDA